jgi:2-hydroxy-3-oxopropionate reductase
MEAGAGWAEAPAAAVEGAGVVITMLTDGRAVEAALFQSGAAAALSAGARPAGAEAPRPVVVDMSSTSPAVAREHAARLADLGVDYVDAPVSGGTRGAAAGTLAIMAGGAEAAVARLAPVFAPMGRVRRVGPVGAGQLAKLANQVIVAVTIGAVAEALLLAERGGADPAAVREALAGGFADSRVLNEHGRRMLDRDFAPGGTVQNQVKDLDAAFGEAEAAGLDLPLLTAVRELFHHLRAAGGGGFDHSALLLEIERRASSRGRGGGEGHSS